MKKKIIVVIFAAVFCCSLAAGLTACKKISHEHTYETEVVAPTCTEQGYTLHTCTGCGDSYKDTYVSALGHSYGEPSWAWSEDYTNATATFTCTNDSEHVNTLTATVTDEVTTPVTCTTDGEKDYTATVTFNNQTYTDVKTVTVKKTGHSISGNSCVNCGQPASEGLDMVLISEGEYTVSGIGTCTDTEILIPTTYNGLPVVSVEASAFLNNTAITSVVLPDSITSIGENAFNGCESLTSVTFGKNSQLSSIGPGAFNYCYSLESITIPESVTNIGSDAFIYCYGLRSVTFGENSQLTSIGDGAFYNCTNLVNVSLPDSLTSISFNTFYGCTNLQTYDDGTASYLGNSENHYLVLVSVISKEITSFTIDDKTKFIWNGAFNGCRSLERVDIPDSILGIGHHAFQDCNSLTAIKIPYGITTIEDGTFFCCTNMQTITIPETVTSIGQSAFEGCNNLKSISIPNSVTSIGNKAFYECKKLENIIIPDGVTFIRFDTFNGCESLEWVSLPESVYYIDQFAFKNCSSLKSIIIPSAVTDIAFAAFLHCDALTTVYYGGTEDKWSTISIEGNNGCLNGVRKYYFSQTEPEKDGYFWHFDTDGVTPVSWGNEPNYSYGLAYSLNSDGKGYTVVGMGDCIDKDLIIPSTHEGLPVNAIGENAFNGNTDITYVLIDRAVTSIGQGSFNLCKSLKNVYYNGTKEEWETLCSSIGVSNDYLIDAKVYYFSQTQPEEGFFWHFDTDGKTPVSWGVESNYSVGLKYSLNTDEKGYTVVGIGYCEDTDLVIPATYRGLPVTAIGSKAFESVRSFKSVSIPASVTTIGEKAFAHCGVTSVTFATNSQLTTVDMYAFFSSSSLQNIALPDGVTTIGVAAFA